jgi:hypothetical protein
MSFVPSDLCFGFNSWGLGFRAWGVTAFSAVRLQLFFFDCINTKFVCDMFGQIEN